MANMVQNSALEFWKKPDVEEIYMIVGWQQWADAGSVSSGLPEYLIQQSRAQAIGQIKPDGFYLFQVPGTHDLVRPVVRFVDGYPETLETQQNNFYFHRDGDRGVVIFRGDEPHMDIDRYVSSLLQAARSMNVRRIVGLGGVYGELPYDKERMLSCNFSLPRMKDELVRLAVNFSNYQGGASMGSMLCKRAGEQDIEYAGLYAMVPAYDFSMVLQSANSIRIENDYSAWLGIMRRINYMLKLTYDLRDLEEKSAHLVKLVHTKLEEMERAAPQLGLSEYMARLSEEFQEPQFEPLDDVWEQELKRLMEKFDDSEE